MPGSRSGAENSGNPGLNEPVLLKQRSDDPPHSGCGIRRSSRLTGCRQNPGAVPVLKN
jgi:hypothetical protein